MIPIIRHQDHELSPIPFAPMVSVINQIAKTGRMSERETGRWSGQMIFRTVVYHGEIAGLKLRVDFLVGWYLTLAAKDWSLDFKTEDASKETKNYSDYTVLASLGPFWRPDTCEATMHEFDLAGADLHDPKDRFKTEAAMLRLCVADDDPPLINPYRLEAL